MTERQAKKMAQDKIDAVHNDTAGYTAEEEAVIYSALVRFYLDVYNRVEEEKNLLTPGGK